MKINLLLVSLLIANIVVSCSGNMDNNDTSTVNTDENSKPPSISKESESHEKQVETISLEDLDPEMEIIEVKDDKGNILQVVKDPETGEETILDVNTNNPFNNPFEGISSGEGPIEIQTDTQEPAFNIHEYTKLNTFLGKYVSNGHVNYASIKSNKSELNEIIKEFESTTPENTWSKNQRMAFWINAYNIFTIKLIVDNYPTSSIKKITVKPWDKKFISIGDKNYSLNNIETDILRKNYDEPKIHFALNCASKSCPILLNKAFMPSSLSSQLTAQTKVFLKDTSKNDLSGKKNIKISEIFNWYKDDFSSSGGVIEFINKYHGSSFKSPKISYMEYSWDLNK